nr:hypothetical protein [Klebsiella oxytoca]
MQTLNGFFRISQFSSVFGIQSSDIALAGLHVGNGGVRQSELFSGFITLLFESDGVVAIVVHEESQYAD